MPSCRVGSFGNKRICFWIPLRVLVDRLRGDRKITRGASWLVRGQEGRGERGEPLDRVRTYVQWVSNVCVCLCCVSLYV